MKQKSDFFKEAIVKTAMPITLQSLFQASFGVVDQIMTGQLGSVAVAGIGLGGKFASLFSVVAAAVATGAGILMSQYIGGAEKNEEGKRSVAGSFWLNLLSGGLIALVFTLLGTAFARPVMSLYSTDRATILASADYLRIIAIGFLPAMVSLMVSTCLRCHGYAKFPLYATVASAVVNTGLNYMLIFGKFGAPKLGMEGAAYATTAARFVEFAILVLFMGSLMARKVLSLPLVLKMDAGFYALCAKILLPLLGCEFLWSVGENVYAVIYGRMSTEACAAMTLTGPVQALMIGALTGIAQATGIMVGRELGKGEAERAYEISKKFTSYGLIASLGLSVVLILLSGLYVQMFEVEPEIQKMTTYILYVYALIAPVKVQNMILGGGVLRSGGKTGYIMAVDAIGTWGFGVPLGFLASYGLGLPIHLVYLMLSLEEVVRLLISIWMFKKRIWMAELSVGEGVGA